MKENDLNTLWSCEEYVAEIKRLRTQLAEKARIGHRANGGKWTRIRTEFEWWRYDVGHPAWGPMAVAKGSILRIEKDPRTDRAWASMKAAREWFNDAIREAK